MADRRVDGRRPVCEQRRQSLRFAALTTSLYTREAWDFAGRGERVREYVCRRRRSGRIALSFAVRYAIIGKE